MTRSIHEKYQKKKKKNKSKTFKVSAPRRNEEFELLDRLYSISDIQDYFEYILKKNGENTINPLIRLYVNKIETTSTFKIRTWDYLELLTLETVKLL